LAFGPRGHRCFGVAAPPDLELGSGTLQCSGNQVEGERFLSLEVVEDRAAGNPDTMSDVAGRRLLETMQAK